MKTLAPCHIDRFKRLVPCRKQKLKLPLIKVCQKLDTLYTLGVSYQQVNQIEKAFGFYYRFVDAAVDKLPKHPNYDDLSPEYKEELCKRTIRAISMAEKLKSEIFKLYCKDSENSVEMRHQ